MLRNSASANRRSRGSTKPIVLIATCAIVCAIVAPYRPVTPAGFAQRSLANASQEVRAADYASVLASEAAPMAAPTTAPAFLKSIGIPGAWAELNVDVTATIAIVDTGVDYNHPELKPYLLEGKNLINDRKSAQDDNGHGTAVAGVIAAIAKAGDGSPGQGRWKGRLLPVKALDQYGSGNEEKLTEGIKYAVDQKADIIVLSLGLRRDAAGLRDAVAYAESKGALLVAASGNDAAVFGTKAAVQYPASYPSVLAVSGSDGGKPIAQSTSGPENDVSAAWLVQTLAIGGGGIEMEGTSMGAPQVAAVAAMLMAKHPDWEPLRVREALRRFANRGAPAEWSENVGYGYLSADRTLQADSDLTDWREPNDVRSDAKRFPLGKEVAGLWGSASDNDWFKLDVPYDGLYSVSGEDARLSLYSKDGMIVPREATNLQGGIYKQWQVKKGSYWLQVLKPISSAVPPDGYRLVSRFGMDADAIEPNDSAASAFTLPARNQQWTGSFHKRGDADWVTISLPKPGILKVTVATDTTRIDPGLWIQPAGGSGALVDDRGDGGSEQWIGKVAKAGKIFIRITNAVSSNPDAVIGTYAATLEYITEKEDFYEPNEGPLTSTPLTPDKVYNGLIYTAKDQDWYRFTLTKKQLVKLSAEHIPDQMALSVELRNKKLQTLKKWNNAEAQKSILGQIVLQPGSYYVKVTADRNNRNQYYGLKMQLSVR